MGVGYVLRCMRHPIILIRCFLIPGHLVGAVATSAQRGNAVTWLAGSSRALAEMGRRRTAERVREDEEEMGEAEYVGG